MNSAANSASARVRSSGAQQMEPEQHRRHGAETIRDQLGRGEEIAHHPPGQCQRHFVPRARPRRSARDRCARAGSCARRRRSRRRSRSRSSSRRSDAARAPPRAAPIASPARPGPRRAGFRAASHLRPRRPRRGARTRGARGAARPVAARRGARGRSRDVPRARRRYRSQSSGFNADAALAHLEVEDRPLERAGVAARARRSGRR